jgi:hypothetical protein
MNRRQGFSEADTPRHCTANARRRHHAARRRTCSTAVAAHPTAESKSRNFIGSCGECADIESGTELAFHKLWIGVDLVSCCARQSCSQRCIRRPCWPRADTAVDMAGDIAAAGTAAGTRVTAPVTQAPITQRRRSTALPPRRGWRRPCRSTPTKSGNAARSSWFWARHPQWCSALAGRPRQLSRSCIKQRRASEWSTSGPTNLPARPSECSGSRTARWSRLER